MFWGVDIFLGVNKNVGSTTNLGQNVRGQNFLGSNVFWGCRHEKECVHYGKARTPYGVRNTLITFLLSNIQYIQQSLNALSWYQCTTHEMEVVLS